MRARRTPRSWVVVAGLGASLALGSCGGPDPAEAGPPAAEARGAVAAPAKGGTCSVFGVVSGAVLKGVRITASAYCPDMGCWGKLIPSPKATTTNAAGEFRIDGLSADWGELYALRAERRGYAFDGAKRFACSAGQLLGPFSFVATPAAAPAAAAPDLPASPAPTAGLAGRAAPQPPHQLKHVVAGTITGSVVAGVTVRLALQREGLDCCDDDPPWALTTTDSRGRYVFQKVRQPVIVTPILPGFTFIPASRVAWPGTIAVDFEAYRSELPPEEWPTE